MVTISNTEILENENKKDISEEENTTLLFGIKYENSLLEDEKLLECVLKVENEQKLKQDYKKYQQEMFSIVKEIETVEKQSNDLTNQIERIILSHKRICKIKDEKEKIEKQLNLMKNTKKDLMQKIKKLDETITNLDN